MRVREARGAARQSAAPKSQPKSHTFPAPVRGWVRNENLAASGPAGAIRFENCFPTTKGFRFRGGSKTKATISTGAVTSQWTYSSGVVEKHFAADASNIFDITSVADPDTIPTAAVSGQTSGYYSAEQIGTAGGDYQVAVNGTDDAQLYDGTSFAALNSGSTPAITGVATADLSFVWKYASRLFFVEKNTMNAWYLDVDSVGGTANKFSLAGVFQQGGSLMFGGRWSLDSGSGLDDKCVFVSTTGEVAIYQGTNPGTADEWTLVGVYQISRPLGINATMNAGGDFLIATVDGIVPLSEAIKKDTAALSLSAITRAIDPEWKVEVSTRDSLPWEIAKWPEFNMAVVSLPVTSSSVEPYCFVVNLQSGAWAKYTGWDTRCLTVFDGYGYFGTADGKVKQMEVTGSDDGQVYIIDYVGLFEGLGAPGRQKTVKSARSTVLGTVKPDMRVTVETDYQIKPVSSPSVIEDPSAAVWDTAIWDQDVWDETAEKKTRIRWQSVGRTGFAIAPRVVATCGGTATPDIELVSVDVLFEDGAVQT